MRIISEDAHKLITLVTYWLDHFQSKIAFVLLVLPFAYFLDPLFESVLLSPHHFVFGEDGQWTFSIHCGNDITRASVFFC